MGIPENDGHCESLVDTSIVRDLCPKLLLTIRVWIEWQPGGMYEHTHPGVNKGWWEVSNWTTTDQDEFQTKFRDRIQTAFGNGRFWVQLAGSKPEGVWCDVWIDIMSEKNRKLAHLCVRALNNPLKPDKLRKIADKETPAQNRARRSTFRSACDIGGNTSWFGTNPIDMTISLEHATLKYRVSPHQKTSDQGEKDFYQTPLLHEFGHYLGLQHRCRRNIAGCGVGADGEPADYCAGGTFEEMNDLMAMGNTLRSAHGQVFADRMENKHGGSKPYAWLANDLRTRPWILQKRLSP